MKIKLTDLIASLTVVSGMGLTTAFYLPVTMHASDDFGNSQSIAMTKNSNGAYVSYVTNEPLILAGLPTLT